MILIIQAEPSIASDDDNSLNVCCCTSLVCADVTVETNPLIQSPTTSGAYMVKVEHVDVKCLSFPAFSFFLAITSQTDVPDLPINSTHVEIHAALALLCFTSHLQHHLELWCLSFGDVSGFSQRLLGSLSVL